METPQTPPPVTPQQNWRLYLELIALTGFVIPFGTILGPVILWQMKKDTEAAVKTYGPDVINFHISWILWSIVTCGLGALVYLVFWIIRMVKAANLEEYKAPLTLTLIK
jgi:uncharacterized Tic20 family protein